MSAVTIARRFNGPPDSANGGYTCGLLAELLEGGGAGGVDPAMRGQCAEVSLRRPPPLARPLAVEHGDRGVALLDGGERVAEAFPTTLALEVPPAVSAAAAREATERNPFLEDHPFPTCFVCGPGRPQRDGLAIFCGPTGEGDLHAASWTPDPGLAGEDGSVRPEFVWASLDCPTAVPVANPGSDPPIVLGRMAARLLAPVRGGEEHVVTAWPIAFEGRKRHAGSALFTAAGELRACARALWVELGAT